MNSQITITFNSVPPLGTTYSFTDSYTGVTLTETFVTLRAGVGESTRDASEQITAQNYRNAINSDYNITALYQTGVLANVGGQYVVTIIANNVQSQFTEVSNTTAGAISATISNTAVTNFTIDTVTIAQATNPCDNVEITVNTSETADNITMPLNQTVTTNPFVFTYPRSSNNIRIAMNKNGVSDSEIILVPKLLASDFNVQMFNSPSSADISVQRIAPSGLLSYEYSIDGTNFQTNQNFTGLALGNYTLTIRDNIGCSITIDFEVNSFTPTIIDFDPICEVSVLNPIHFKEVQTIANCGTQKNATNTLSYEEETDLNYRNFKQKFQTCDTITTQIKTNYETIEAKITDCQGNETNLIVDKKTSNMNLTDARDVVVSSLVNDNYNGYAGLNFPSGNTYDPVTFAQNGSFNDGLPSWIDIDEYVNIRGIGWFRVIDKLQGSNGGILVLNTLYSSLGLGVSPQTEIVSTIYNAVNFERWEFEIDFSTLTTGDYQVSITVSDSDTSYETKQYLSEWIDNQVSHDRCFVIDYYHTKANEINFNTGMRGKLRIPYIQPLKYAPDEEQEILVTDTNTVLLDAKVRETYKMELRQLPTTMLRKMVAVLNMDRLFINNLNYLKTGNTEPIELGVRNEQLLNATLVRSDYTFEVYTLVNDNENIDGIPLAINSDSSGFLFVE